MEADRVAQCAGWRAQVPWLARWHEAGMGLGSLLSGWRLGGWTVGAGGQAGLPARLSHRAFTPQPAGIRSEVGVCSPLGLYSFFFFPLAMLAIELRALCMLLSYISRPLFILRKDIIKLPRLAWN